MSTIKNKGSISFMLENWKSTKIAAKTRKSRVSSAFPLGAICQRPKTDPRENSYLVERINLADSNCLFPCFTVGPCYLVSKPNKYECHRSSADKEDALASAQRRMIFTEGEKTDEDRIVAKAKDVLGASEHKDIIGNKLAQKGSACSSDVSGKSSSLQLSSQNRKSKCKASKIYKRKQKRSRRSSRRCPQAKDRVTKDMINHTPARDLQTTNTPLKDKCCHIVVASNSAGSDLRIPLPTLTPRQVTPFEGVQYPSSKVKSDCLSIGADKISVVRESANRTTKVYLSERQSGLLMGIPAVPPCTPFLDENCNKEWIPSMSDIKSQRLITNKLSHLFTKQSKKEQNQKIALEQKRHLDEKKERKDFLSKLKQRQRAEIYALNRIMSAIELKNYGKFEEEKGMPV